jgi:GR25 family glycosyltransferase involved in LPS biosynthesis
MKAFAIYQPKEELSVIAFIRLKHSIENQECDLELVPFSASTPETIGDLKYAYPLEGETKTVDNLKLVGYRCSDVKKKIACTLSHLRLWKKCVELNEEIMILEHDALFVRRFKPFKWDGGVLGLNNPLGATRLSKVFYAKAEASEAGVSNCPFVDEQNVPQGLAGNSAYIIKPAFAERLINKVEEVGIWPNDALMCNQLFPNELKIITPFYTKVQGGISTTT